MTPLFNKRRFCSEFWLSYRAFSGNALWPSVQDSVHGWWAPSFPKYLYMPVVSIKGILLLFFEFVTYKATRFKTENFLVAFSELKADCRSFCSHNFCPAVLSRFGTSSAAART